MLCTAKVHHHWSECIFFKSSTGHIYYILHRNAIKSENDFFLWKIVSIWLRVWFKFMWKYSISRSKSALLGPNFEEQQKVRFWFVSAFCVCDLDCVFSTTIDHAIWLHPKRELMLRCIKIEPLHIEFSMSEHTVRAQNGGLSFPLAFFFGSNWC